MVKLKALLIPVAIVGVIGLSAGAASAHSAQVTPICGKVTFHADSNYEGNASNNKVSIVIDGGAPQVTFFGSSGVTVDVTLTKTVVHTFAVSVDANINTGNPTQYDIPSSANGFHGTIEPCETPPTTTTMPPTTTTTLPPTTTTLPPTTTTEPPTTTTIPETTAPATTTTAPPVTEPPTTSTVQMTAPVPTTQPPPTFVPETSPFPLPNTGSRPVGIAMLAIAALILGIGAVRTARRPIKR